MDLANIAPRLTGQRETFEELCCQLALQDLPAAAEYRRLYGAGGDGGVECYADLPDAGRIGWQAKYVFDVDRLLRQVTKSLTTALEIHPELTRYVVCFPFNLTGPTGRDGESGTEKFEEWRKEQIAEASVKGRTLEIEKWDATKIRSLLLQHDDSGGMRAYFFGETALSDDWFGDHVRRAQETAEPRYTPDLNVKTNVARWFSAFGRTDMWRVALEGRAKEAREEYGRLVTAIKEESSAPARPEWPDSIREDGQKVASRLDDTLEATQSLVETQRQADFNDCVEALDTADTDLGLLEDQLRQELEEEHGPGADSPGFRQHMAEYQASFPAANLDLVRDVRSKVKGLLEWLRSPGGFLAFQQMFVLSGAWGVGKTHSVCDAAQQRLDDGLLTCVVFGHEFDGRPDPWTRFAECLGFPTTYGKEKILDALDTAAKASGKPLVVTIDALNETRPLRYWRDRIQSVAADLRRRSHLKLCVTCRTPFVEHCLPTGFEVPVVEHPGFEGIERMACTSFFEHYDLEPPVAPILQPELANPLFLKLVCQTLRARGMRRLPAAWSSMSQVIDAFLERKEIEFARETGVNRRAGIVGSSLRAIVGAIAESGNATISWSDASEAVVSDRPEADELNVVAWLVGENLLVTDAPSGSRHWDSEYEVRPAFERLGDFLVAEELLDRSLEGVKQDNGNGKNNLQSKVQELVRCEENYGVLSALSALIPERRPGTELPELVKTEEHRETLLEMTLKAFPWRHTSSFTQTTRTLIREGLSKEGLARTAIDSVLAIAWRQSPVDATWLHRLLMEKPLAQRDEFWCGYLHLSYEDSGVVKRLIDAAFELPLDDIDLKLGVRWAMALLWFTAAADRRIKDWATRANIQVLAANPEVMPEVIDHFLPVDDDAVRERLLLVVYGALIQSGNREVVASVSTDLLETFDREPTRFSNALLRDHSRCIAEFASTLEVGDGEIDPMRFMESIPAEWPLNMPAEDQVDKTGKQIRFMPDEFASDFYKYSMDCLRPWQHEFSKKNMGKWIVKRVAHDFGYLGSGCERYDDYMVGTYGGGRAKPTWVERIGKKYQWQAMYQLASRLHDNVERQQRSWDPEPLQAPLILLEERELDPTLPPTVSEAEGNSDGWRDDISVDFSVGESLSDPEWVNLLDDLPSLKRIINPSSSALESWRVLVTYPGWSDRAEDQEWTEPHRQVWMHLQSYLVPEEDASSAWDALLGRNFFGKWLPEGADWLYGFAGEYPWATPFNTEPDQWHGRSEETQDSSLSLIPTWNSLVVEWEYDATLPDSFKMAVPARSFFELNDMSWDGRDGYSLTDDKTVFRDPSVSSGGPSVLIARDETLRADLAGLGFRLIWTLLGEKIISGAGAGATPRRTFSQVARLEHDGTIEVSDRAVFDDYEEARGPKEGDE